MACFCAVWLSWRRAAFTNKFVLRILTLVCQMFSFCCEGLSFTGSFMGINLDFRILQALKRAGASSTNRMEMSQGRSLCKHVQIVRSRGRRPPALQPRPGVEDLPVPASLPLGDQGWSLPPPGPAQAPCPPGPISCPEGPQDKAPDETLGWGDGAPG